jgi:hypothetical protein
MVASCSPLTQLIAANCSVVTTALLHLTIGHSSWSHLPAQKPRGWVQMPSLSWVLHGDCGACFAALSRGEDALRLNATVRIGVYRPQVVV